MTMKIGLAFLCGLLTVVVYACSGTYKMDKPAYRYGLNADTVYTEVRIMAHNDDSTAQPLGIRSTIFVYGRDSLICIGYDISDTLGLLRALGDSTFQVRQESAYCVDAKALLSKLRPKPSAGDSIAIDTVQVGAR